MNEIELKAHVYDREKLIEKLNSFAEYADDIVRDDTYYTADGVHKIRIRKEQSKNKTQNILTYKRKELKKDSNNISYEVNEEIETTVNDTKPLETFFCDSGFKISLKKHKDVKLWKAEVLGYTASLELCAVEKLGDFLEIEILTESSDEAEILKIKDTLKQILKMADIPESQIENKYYSEMLREISR